MKKRIPLLCLFALAPLAAWANIIPTGTTITGTDPYTWVYDLQLSGDQNVASGMPPTANPVPRNNANFGSFLTIFDFEGYVAGSCTGPAGWTCTTQNVGYTPDDVLPTDDADIVNLTWVYTSGPMISGSPNGVSLGLFSAQSIYNTITQVSYAARGIKNLGSQIGTISDNVGNVQGPTSQVQVVPEPASLGLAALGFVLLAGVGSRKRGQAS